MSIADLKDGSNLVQYARNVNDAAAVEFIYDLVAVYADNQPSNENIPNIADRVQALRQNIDKGNVEKVFPELLADFKNAADRQDKLIELTRDQQIVLPEYPHHENVVKNHGDWSIAGGRVVASPADVFGPIITNPYDIALDAQTNLDFVTSSGRMMIMIEAYAEKFNIAAEQVAEAAVGYCYTVAAKRCWAIANGKELKPEEVKPEYFLAVAKEIQAIGYKMDLD